MYLLFIFYERHFFFHTAREEGSRWTLFNEKQVGLVYHKIVQAIPTAVSPRNR
jgi:hypothetical protein